MLVGGLCRVEGNKGGKMGQHNVIFLGQKKCNSIIIKIY